MAALPPPTESLATLSLSYPSWGSHTCSYVLKDAAAGVLLTAPSESQLQAKTAAIGGTPPPKTTKKHAALGQIASTAIAGNDLTSSCLYTAGLAASISGPLAPVALATVTLMLYFFRAIYVEVVTALPQNGGSYNALLNSSSKHVAAFAACLSILSYVATAVVSAADALIYLNNIAGVDVRGGTIIVLAVFALLTAAGTSESSPVAIAMFALHISMMSILAIWSLAWAGSVNKWALLSANVNAPLPDIETSTGVFLAHGSIGSALFFGYCSALLGITGFESAANFVEEVREARVYKWTLRNMWLAVGLFNPLLSFCAMCVLDMKSILGHPSDLLSAMAGVVGGPRFQTFVVVDAVIVLCGAVLTCYVGVVGLCRRMARDRALPSFLARVNVRGSAHWVIVLFFILTASLFLMVYDPANPDGLHAMGGVYSIAFLSVMTAFGVACALLKLQRPELPRLDVVSWPVLIVSVLLVLVGLIGNIVLGPDVFRFFVIYLAVFVVCVFSMLYRATILRAVIWAMQNLCSDTRTRAHAAEQVAKLREAHDRFEARKHDVDLVGLSVPHAGADENGSSIIARGTSFADGGSFIMPTSADSAGSIIMANVDKAGNALARTTPPSGVQAPQTCRERALTWLMSALDNVMNQPVVYFAKHSDLFTLNQAVEYVRRNEPTQRLIIVHVMDDRRALRDAALRLRDEQRAAAAETGASVSTPRGVEEGESDGDDVSAPPSPATAAASTGASSSIASSTLATGGALIRRLRSSMRDLTGLGSATAAAAGDATNSAAPSTPMAVVTAVARLRTRASRTATYRIGAHTKGGALTSEELARLLPPLRATARLLQDNCSLLDTIYPQLRIDCMIVRGTHFGPGVVEWLSRYLSLSPNMMLMSVPNADSKFSVASLGGVRVIIQGATSRARRVAEVHLQDVLIDAAVNASELASLRRAHKLAQKAGGLMSDGEHGRRGSQGGPDAALVSLPARDSRDGFAASTVSTAVGDAIVSATGEEEYQAHDAAVAEEIMMQGQSGGEGGGDVDAAYDGNGVTQVDDEFIPAQDADAVAVEVTEE